MLLEMHTQGRKICQFDRGRVDGRFRRVSPLAVRPGEGLLTEPIAGVPVTTGSRTGVHP